ncbi:hypothetical protein GCK72_023402 [Caenorhabditis remanei]|uniref:Uncharacterized protein n=1 Tax=Caenorhabditis remanei TaxID=31234 RepID=A0A6A5FWT1_CAERE|nr:hypothetical protein GCK72_023402 [Caenorhabditis remanei]KAF1746944.1 hypothetical protein GCK72_023402 [Caenorhabditis remanei]
MKVRSTKYLPVSVSSICDPHLGTIKNVLVSFLLALCLDSGDVGSSSWFSDCIGLKMDNETTSQPMAESTYGNEGVLNHSSQESLLDIIIGAQDEWCESEIVGHDSSGDSRASIGHLLADDTVGDHVYSKSSVSFWNIGDEVSLSMSLLDDWPWVLHSSVVFSGNWNDLIGDKLANVCTEFCLVSGQVEVDSRRHCLVGSAEHACAFRQISGEHLLKISIFSTIKDWINKSNDWQKINRWEEHTTRRIVCVASVCYHQLERKMCCEGREEKSG